MIGEVNMIKRRDARDQLVQVVYYGKASRRVRQEGRFKQRLCTAKASAHVLLEYELSIDGHSNVCSGGDLGWY